MGFIFPEMLWSFLLLLPLLMAWTFVARFRDGKLARFMVKENWGVLNNQVSSRARFHKGLLILLALSFSIIAAARPYWGVQEREVQKRGTTIIFAIDTSESMMARDTGPQTGVLRESDDDVPPNRLDAARTLVRQILAEMPGQRIGIMPFAGDAFLQAPPTTDYGLLYDIINQVDFDSIGDPGTDFPRLINQSVDVFERLQGGSKALVILSDGEDHSEATQEAAEKAAEAGIRIFSLGIGSLDGTPLRLPDGSIKEDRQGSKVLTRLEPETLRRMSSETGGSTYIAGSSGMIDPTGIIDDLASLGKEDFEKEKRVIRNERYQWPLGLAMVILMIEMVIHDRKRRKKSFGRHRGFVEARKAGHSP